ncbi:unnamed protein product [Prorocentrum cordatum]|uniref:Glycoside hydrolase family 3 C-terminal domain-containing protein n=1 Tax=Prorocentrum cordatum TaxID=2364126 RepID=A0ABN9T915_9DINO|nr:unnamed protein product [Polarella glacialis]
MLSNYHGQRCASNRYECITSPIQAISKANAGGQTVGVVGVGVAGGPNNISAAVEAAQAADVVVLVVGIDGSQEGEEHDRSDCGLPGHQPELVEAISALKKPTVMVLIHGGALCLGHLKEGVPAIVDAFYGGESGSEALAAVLFGEYNPSGKLPVTMYPPEYMQQLPITQMSVSAPPGRTHLYYTGTPEFPFGAGLSYSSWAMEVAEGAQRRLGTRSGAASFTVRLTNAGPWAGSQRVLALARPRGATAPGALRQRMWGYQGAQLAVGETADLVFTLRSADLALSDASGNRVVSPGEWDVVFSHGDGEVLASVVMSGAEAVVEPSVFGKSTGTGTIVV